MLSLFVLQFFIFWSGRIGPLPPADASVTVHKFTPRQERHRLTFIGVLKLHRFAKS
jgi:hypothetical protein